MKDGVMCIRSRVFKYNCPADPATASCTIKNSVGCYKNALPVQANAGNVFMTKELCASICFGKGFSGPADMAGVKSGQDCWCGNSLASGAESREA